MTLSIIVAMAKNRVIGNKGKIPWHLSEDLKRFKQITMGHPVLMGRKTFESIGKPLPGRTNIVISRNEKFRSPGITVARSLQEAVKRSGEGEAFVIGGAKIYTLALPIAGKIYLTLIEKDFEGDTFFPEVNLKNDFRIVEEGPIVVSARGQIPYRFIIYRRRHTKRQSG